MKKIFQQGLVLACAVALAACGGSEGNYITSSSPTIAPTCTTNTTDTENTSASTTSACTTTSGTGTTGTGTGTTGTGTGTTGTTPALVTSLNSLEVAASSRQLASSGDTPVTISAIAKDANNNVVKNVSVQFSVDGTATIEPDEATAAGAVKTALLTPGLGNPENRTLTVTIKAANQVRTLNVDVTGTAVQLDGPSRIAIGSPATFTVKLSDSADKGLAYQTVQLSSRQGNIISPIPGRDFTTDAKGEVQFTLSAGLGGADIVTASALGASFSKSVDISGDEFTLSSVNKEITVNSAETISLLWKHNGVAQANKVIKLSATRGLLPVQVTTNADGYASFAISSGTAGAAVITATEAVSGLSTSMNTEFVAVTPAYLSVQSEQSVVNPDGSVSIIALVRDKDDNPVKNQIVSFSLNDTVNGTLSSSQATTDSLGRATVVYTAGNATSAKNGVVIRAFLPANSTILDDVNLTVGSRALRLVLGNDEKLEEEGVYYKQTFGVIVTDSNGNAIKDATVNFAVVPLAYRKGEHVCVSGKWTLFPIEEDSESTLASPEVACPAEDVDHDGWMDAGEDFNSSGKLEPTHVASVTPSAVTDADGKVSVAITYPQSHAEWNYVRLIASIQNAGTEYVESSSFWLRVLAGDVASCEVAAPNQRSPYGQALNCASPF